jgi:hypothetical protein
MPKNQKIPPAASAIDAGRNDSEKSSENKGLGSTVTLRQTVKQALLNVLLDVSASAAAKASAGRTLLEYFDDAEHARGASGKRSAELTLDELEREIESLKR